MNIIFTIPLPDDKASAMVEAFARETGFHPVNGDDDFDAWLKHCHGILINTVREPVRSYNARMAAVAASNAALVATDAEMAGLRSTLEVES